MQGKGRFIVVEGLEGAGKTTAVETIRHFLEAGREAVVVTREPGGTAIGEGLRILVKEGVNNQALCALSEVLVLYAARVQLLTEVIKPALQRGDWVISDRFELSTYAYQGGGRAIDKTTLDSLSSLCLQGFKPDLIFFMDISPKLGLSRAKSRGVLDKIEQESLPFFTRVYETYHRLIQNMDNVYSIDASLPLAEVQAAILAKLQSWS